MKANIWSCVRGASKTLPAFFALAPLLAGQSTQQQAPAAPIPPAALKSMTLEQLSQIDVTSPSKEPTPAFRSPTAIYVITGEDIRRAGVRTIPDALRLAPGVEVAQIDSDKWSIGIRGFGSRLNRDVLVLIDGRTVYSPLFAGTYWEVQDTLLEDIDRIEVIRGPGGTIWGPNAVDGVINIITKSSRDTQGTFAEAGGGNHEQGFASARYGGDAGNGLTYRVYVKGFERGAEHHFDGDNFDHWRGVQAGFRMDWAKTARDTITLQGDAYKQEDGERVQLGNYVPPFEETVDGTAQLSGGNLLFRWKRVFSNGNDIQVQTYYDRTNRYEPNFGDRLNTFDADYLERTKLPWRQELLYGVEGRDMPGHFLEVGSGLVFYPPNRTDYLVSGFLEDDINLIDRKLLLTAGSKVLHTNYIAGAEFEPSIRLMWTPDASQTFWTAFTHAVRTPSDAEEDFYLSSYLGTLPNGTEEFARFNPNPNFAPEQLNGYEAGYRQLIAKNFFVDIATFYNHYHDLFSEDLVSESFGSGLPFPGTAPPSPYVLITGAFQNDFYGTTKGIEIAPEWRPAKFWRLRGTWSLLNMHLMAKPGAYAVESPESITGASPVNQVTAESSLDLPKKLQLDLVFRYVGALPAEITPSYATGDARIAWQFSRHMEFSLSGRNLFQPFHVEYGLGDPGGPIAIIRNVFATVAWR